MLIEESFFVLPTQWRIGKSDSLFDAKLPRVTQFPESYSRLKLIDKVPSTTLNDSLFPFIFTK